LTSVLLGVMTNFTGGTTSRICDRPRYHPPCSAVAATHSCDLACSGSGVDFHSALDLRAHTNPGSLLTAL
ncbi:MAG TPA: hypothetical protein VMV52_02230, partial [Candidatus Nanopelagicaceae bacterium]|nr:hypothetical protein [Candidatus Nanopelagicaceae bacterium]